MIVHDFNVMCLAVAPHETDPPLVVDPDAMLSCAITFERFKAIAGWNAQILQSRGGMKVVEPPPGHALDRMKSAHVLVLIKCRCVTASKRPYQS